MSDYKEPRVDCCEYGRAYIIPRYKFTEKDYDNVNAFRDVVPIWYIRGCNIDMKEWNRFGWIDDSINVCPKCSTELPELELIPDLKGNFPTMDCDGEYCGTCNNRANECTCTHPIKMWRIKK